MIQSCEHCGTLVSSWRFDEEKGCDVEQWTPCRLCSEDERRSRRERFDQRMEFLREDGISCPNALRHTFEQDDGQNKQISDACKRYVERWAEMKKSNIGILFYGVCGSGKSFLSSCIGRALLDRCVTVAATSFPRLLNILQEARDKQAVIDGLSRYELLIIDDLGTERDSSFALEKTYEIVNSRYEAELPVIVSTNLSLQEMEKPQNLRQAQIYTRILERCPVRMKMPGAGRREGIAEERKKIARQLLG